MRPPGDGVGPDRKIETRALACGRPGPPHGGPAGPHDAADADVECGGRRAVAELGPVACEHAGQDATVHVRRGSQAGEQRCHHERADVAVQWREVPGQHPLGDRDPGIGQPPDGGDGAVIGGLVPRRRHECLLVLLHHLDAEGRGDPSGRVEVELFVPAGHRRGRASGPAGRRRRSAAGRAAGRRPGPGPAC